EGTLYPLLARMKNAGWLHYTWKESDQGPPRKYYHITEEGSTFLNLLLGAWNDLVNVVNLSTKTLQKPKKKTTRTKKAAPKSNSNPE
ncbi:MAG: PadR family transcriptional regulator, partial [Saprospiraceae bacterium]